MNEYAWHYFNLSMDTHIDPSYLYVLLCPYSGKCKCLCRLSQIMQFYHCHHHHHLFHHHPQLIILISTMQLQFHYVPAVFQFAVLLAIWIADFGSMLSYSRTAHLGFSLWAAGLLGTYLSSALESLSNLTWGLSNHILPHVSPATELCVHGNIISHLTRVWSQSRESQIT